ncbi:MAG: hypothetical protein LBG06_05070 [Deltaproteobacteria bacterium]|jgi:hypothetical protein|nr:hypothetical protein [Deltaproteobacteria bacterium]
MPQGPGDTGSTGLPRGIRGHDGAPGSADYGAEGYGEEPGRTPRTGRIVALVLSALLVLLLLIAPSFLLHTALNRDLDPASGWRRMEVDRARVGPLLTGFRAEGLSFYAEGSDGPAVTVESVEGRNLSPLTVLRTLLRGGDVLAVLSGEGEITVRDARLAKDAGTAFLKSGSLSALSLSGLELLEDGEGTVTGTELRSLRLSGLRLEETRGGTLDLDAFSLAGLSGGVAGRITSSALSYADGQGFAVSLAGLSLGPVDLRRALSPGSSSPLRFALSLFEASDSLDLDHISWSRGGAEALYARTVRLDVRDGGDGRPLKTFETAGARISPAALPQALPATPLGRVILALLAPEAEWDLSLAALGLPGGDPRKVEIRVSSPGLLELGVSQEVAGLADLPVLASPEPGPALALLGANLGEGGAWYSDRGASALLYDAISREFYGGGPAAEGLRELLLPAIRSLDPERIVNLGPLEGEAALFLEYPGSLGVRWKPAPGFPGSVAAKAGLFPGGGSAWSLGYALLADMNITVSVNGRAPMGVVTAP